MVGQLKYHVNENNPPSLILSPSYPLLRLPLPGTGPVEFTTGVRDYSVPSHEPQGDQGERPDWVGEEEKAHIFLGFLLKLSDSLIVRPGTRNIIFHFLGKLTEEKWLKLKPTAPHHITRVWFGFTDMSGFRTFKSNPIFLFPHRNQTETDLILVFSSHIF